MKTILMNNGYTVEKITLENLHKYEDVFYCNEEYLVHNKYKRQSIGTKCINALIAAVEGTDINSIRLSVQDNNIGGLSFWKKIGFEIIDETECGEYKNLTMEYSIK